MGFKAIAVLGAGAGLLAATAAPQGGSGWTVSAEPLLSVGGPADAAAEFLMAESAIRLSNGEIVVVSQRSSELKWFTASGQFRRSLGRRGRGPQEFGRTLYVFEGAADTVIVHDADNRRFHYLSPSGEFARLDSAGPRDRQFWLFDRSVVERVPFAADREHLKSALLRIPFAARQAVRSVLVDRAGVLFVGGAAAPHQLRAVHDGEGRRLGSLTLPPRFELYQVYDTMVLGLRAVARKLLPGQELHYSRQQRYAGSLEELGNAAPPRPPGVTQELVAAGPQSYWVVVSHAAMHVVCVVGIGPAVSFGYVEACG